jgi:hypothetical protein
VRHIAISTQDELKIIGEYKPMPRSGMNLPGAPKYNTPITPKENTFRFLKGEGLWAPCGADFVTLCPRIIPDNVARAFVIDAQPIDNATEGGGPDMFGVEWEYVPQVGGSMVRPGSPLKVPDITQWEKYITFPDLDQYDWEGNAKVNAPYIGDGRITMIWILNGLFERLISFMEFENAALALIDDDEKEAVHRLFDKLCDFYDDYIARLHKYYNADAIYFHDDWGSQRAPFFSLNTVREMIVPYLKRVCDSAHKNNMFVDFHSCGKIEPLVPAMIEAGVDVWSGQPMNDRLQVLKQYGDRIKLNFGPTAMFGASEDQVVEETKKFLEVYGPYIGSITVSTGFGGGRKVYEMVYAYSREAFSK